MKRSFKHMHWLAPLALGALVGCSTNPITGRSQFMVVSEGMAGGKMAIYSGMWEKLKATDDEVAQVMGHEIGHALANHTQERMSIAYSTSIGTQLAAIALGARDQTAVLMQQAAVLAIQLPNSRESEAEADQIGIELAARAGYDPAAAVSLWDKMGKLSEGKTPPEFLSTHPSPEHRATRLKELGAKVQPLY